MPIRRMVETRARAGAESRVPMRRAVSESSRAPGSVSIATARAALVTRGGTCARRVCGGDRAIGRARGGECRRSWIATGCSAPRGAFLVFSIRHRDVLSFGRAGRGCDYGYAMVITCASVDFHCSMEAARRAGSRIPILAENPGGNSASRMAAICACASATFDLIGLINASRVLCEFK